MCACIAVGMLNAQENNDNNGYIAEYQLPNSDFEENWTHNERTNSGGKVTYSEETPDFWNSFYTAQGAMSSFAFMLTNQVGSVKPTVGYDGEGYAALIFSRKNALSSISNGNLTSGIINMGSTTANEPENYNFTDIDNPVGRCEFVGLPDSVSVFFKFEPKDASLGNASMNMILHSEYEYKDPGSIMGTEDSLKYLVAIAKASITANSEWVKYTVPFEYNGENYLTDEKRYMLTSFSTNQLPGIGSDGDSLSIDHIRLVYNSRLLSLKIDGIDLEGFDSGVTDYVVEGDVPSIDNVAAVADGIGATIETAVDGNILTVTVKGNDFASNSENIHVYTVEFKGNSSIEDSDYDNISVVCNNGKLCVEGADGENVEVYTLQGMKIATFVADSGWHNIRLNENSVCIVKVGTKVFKVTVQ